jgi:exodeoxyribonuclease VII small subunit
MSKTAKSAGAVNGIGSELPFEEAMKRLEEIVEAMETGDLPLEALLTRFEEGTHMAQVCQAKLAQAELKIQQLEQDPAGGLTVKPVAMTAPVANEG